jgi:hypothetical protein
MSTAGGGVITSGATDNVFADVPPDEATAGSTKYRGIYIKNKHATITWEDVAVWISSLTSSTDTEFDIALADEAVNAAMETIADEDTAPSGPSFTRPTSFGAGLSIGDIPAGQYKGIWIRRTVTAGATAASDSGTITCQGATVA